MAKTGPRAPGSAFMEERSRGGVGEGVEEAGADTAVDVGGSVVAAADSERSSGRAGERCRPAGPWPGELGRPGRSEEFF